LQGHQSSPSDNPAISPAMLGHLQEVFKQTFEIAERQRDWPVQHSITNVVTAEGWQEMLQFVRFGSSADICSAKSHVRFTPESGHGWQS
jgi:hypothetical protein